MVNAGDSSRTISSVSFDIFGALSTNQLAQTTWNLFDWGNQCVMATNITAQILNRTINISNVTEFYNATQPSFAEGLANNETVLFGTPES